MFLTPDGRLLGGWLTPSADGSSLVAYHLPIGTEAPQRDSVNGTPLIAGSRRCWRVLAHAPAQHNFRVARDRLAMPSQLRWEERAHHFISFMEQLWTAMRTDR